MKTIFKTQKNIRNSHLISASGALKKLHRIGLIVLAIMFSNSQAWGATYTAVASLTDGKSYILVAGGYAITASIPSDNWIGGTDVSSSISGSTLTTTATDIVWVAKKYTSGGTTWSFKNGTKYIQNNSGNTYRNMTYNTTESKYTISSGKIYSTGSGATDKYLNYVSGSGFRMYSSNQGSYSFTFYELDEACAKEVTVSDGGSSSHGSITSITTSPVATCSATAADRQVSIVVTPSNGYTAPTDLSVGTNTGTVTSTKVSRTDNLNGTFTFVYRYNQNDNGSISYNAVCEAKTYTISLNDQTPTTAASPSSITATYDSNSNLTGTVVTTLPTKTGFTFGGYWTATGGSGVQLINSSGEIIASASGGGKTYTDASKNWIHSGGVTVYAKWIERDLTNYRTSCIFDIVLHDNNGGSHNGSAQVGVNGTALTDIDPPTKEGYEIEGYYDDNTYSHKVADNAGYLQANVTGYTGAGGAWTRKESETTLYTKWTPNTNTPYTVKHYQQNLDGTYPSTPTETQNLTGTTDASVTPEVKSYTGFTAPSTQTVTILADGSLVVTYYYTRNSYTLTWNANGGNITGDYTRGSVKYGAEITAPANANVTRANYIFAGWDVTPATTMPAANTTYTAQWTAEPEVTISGTIKVTSTNGKTVKAANVLQVSGAHLTTSTITVASSSADFKLSKTGAKSSFSQSITIDVVSNTVETTNIYVAYNPSETTDGINNTVVVTVKDDPSTPTAQASTTAGDIQGRHLPAKFVIATKIDGNWYALPNNVTTASYGTRDLSYPLIVDDATNPTTATIYTSTTDYLAWGLNVAGPTTDRFTTDGDKIAFVSAIGNKGLAGNNSGLRNSAALPATTSDDYPGFTWTPSTTDLANYTLQNGSATSYYVATNGSDKWTTATTGANVRFLAYDAHVAPTITWYNGMLESVHTTNYAENCEVTLPTGADPVSCNTTLLPTFCGWMDGQIATYTTVEPTYVQAGYAATTDKTYYAVFKEATRDRWYTACPTIYAITYKANGGTGDDHVEYTMNTTADAITVAAAGFSKAGSTFVGWTNPADESGAIITPGAGKITGLSGDITLNAVWIGTFNITGTVRLTASAGEKVATGTTDLTISSTDVACATALRITYYDVTNDVTYGRTGTPSYTSSEFRLCNASYSVADGSNIDLTGVSTYDQTFSLTYEPNGGANTLDHYQLKVEVLLKNTVIDTKTLDVYGRTLPASFAIAIKVGGSWYALPNNMSSSNKWDPIQISVTEDASVLNWSAKGPSTVGYKMKDYTPNHSKLRFAANDASEYCLWAATGNAAGIRNYSASSTDANYAWTATPDENFNAYTLANLANTRTALKIYEMQWCMYNSGGFSEIHFIPLTTVTPLDITVMEWGVNEIAVKTVSSWTPSAITAQINGGSPSTVTKTSIGGDIYKLTGVGDLKGNPGASLALNVIDGSAKQAIIQIPFIIAPVSPATSETKTEADLADMLVAAGYATTREKAREITKNMDVMVRNGGTLSSSSSTSGTFKDVYIYPGGHADISKAISMQGLYLRGGYSWLGADFAMPHAKINAAISGLATGNGLKFDYYIDANQYYDLAVPKTMTWVPVTDETGNESFTYWVKQYNGETRASTGKGWEWYNWSGEPSTWAINMGQGYLVAAQPPTGRKYFIMRFPLNMTLPDDETDKALIEVEAYGLTDEGELEKDVSPNNVGWNLIANPFLTSYKKDADGVDEDGSSITGSIRTGELVPEIKDGKWTGKYVWDTSGGKDIRYVTTYNYATATYEQQAMSSTVLEPFTGFFIQVAKDCYVKFDPTGRQNNIIARRANDKLPDDMEIGITASIGAEKDETILLLCDDLSRENALEFPDESSKVINAGHLNFYTFAGATSMYANGMTYAEGQEWNAAGITPTKDGEYTFSVTQVNTNYVEAVLLKDLNSNTEYDLLTSDVNIYLETGTVDDRFAVKIVLKDEKETPTALDEINEEGINRGPEKFIYNNKFYIRYNGVIYDAVGKKVREINK